MDSFGMASVGLSCLGPYWAIGFWAENYFEKAYNGFGRNLENWAMGWALDGCWYIGILDY